MCRDVVVAPDTTTCDLAETCDGSSFTCPADKFKDSTQVCRDAVIADDKTTCDVPEKCTLGTNACPPDGFMTPGTLCREAAGLCDVSEFCTSDSGKVCPHDDYQPATKVCRPAVVACDLTTCDLPEKCTGHDVDCPFDKVLDPNTPCRIKADPCDVEETCKGINTCPLDVRNDDGYVYKCGGTCYLCVVEQNQLEINIGQSSQSYSLGGCGIGSCDTFVQLQWPDCATQCIKPICPNSEPLKNVEIFSCLKDSGDWTCDYMVDGVAVSSGVCPQFPT